MQRKKIYTLQEAAKAGVEIKKAEKEVALILQKSLPRDAYEYLIEKLGFSYELAEAIVIKSSSKIREELKIPLSDEKYAINAIKNAKWDHEKKKISISIDRDIHTRVFSDRIAYDYEIEIKIGGQND